jgi:hypothetical protein
MGVLKDTLKKGRKSVLTPAYSQLIPAYFHGGIFLLG